MKPFAASVARKHSSGSVGAVCGRRQPHDEKPRIRIAESGNRLPPILPIEKTSHSFPCDLLTPLYEAWTSPALHDAGIQR